MLDPAQPEAGVIKVKIDQREAIENVRFSLDNYQRGIESFDFWRYLSNSVIVTLSATLLTLAGQQHGGFRAEQISFSRTRLHLPCSSSAR